LILINKLLGIVFKSSTRILLVGLPSETKN